MGLFDLFRKQEVESVPHPELVPLTEEECSSNIDVARVNTSQRDYSSKEVEWALASGYPSSDMIEYCHSNGIAWQKSVKR